MNPRTADTSAPVLEAIAERWSPRAFDPEHVLPADALRGAIEAARWAPSASNTQPWRFIVGRRGSDTFAQIADALIGFNRDWAQNASALVVSIAETVGADGKPLPWAQYDVGQASALMAVQAHHEGLHTHPMGGFDRDAVRAAFGLEATLEPLAITAIGKLGSPDQLNEKLREREVAPRERKPLDEIVLVRE